MKKIPLLFCLLVIANNLISQFHLPKDSAEWKVWVVNNGIPYSSQLLIYQYSNDTSLNGYSHKVVKPGLFGLNSYIREVDSTQEIFFLLDYSDTISNRILYNFSMSIGDTFKVVNFLGNPVSWVAVSQGVVQVGPSQRRYLDVKYVGFNYTDRWVEGIGSIRGLFAPVLDPPGWFEQDFQLVCFTDKDLGATYEPFPDSIYNCSTPVHVFQTYDVDLQTKIIDLYPNPTNSLLYLENLPINSSVKLYNLDGKLLLQKQFKEEKASLDLSALSKGVYLLEIWNSKGESDFRKVVKE